MTVPALSALISELQGRETLTSDDALAVRRVIFGGDVDVTPEEAEALIAINEAADQKSVEWTQMFVEAVTDFVVRQQEPSGYVDSANAGWLIAAVSRDGRVRRDSELEAVVHIIETATSTPLELSLFALNQAKAKVLSSGRPLEREDVDLLRRVVFAAAGAGSLAVTRAEAEVLFDINDEVRGRDNDPAWTDFYAKAIGNAVMAASGYIPPSREEALRQEAWLEGRGSTVRFLSRMAGSLFVQPSRVLEAYRAPDDLGEVYAEQNAMEAAERPVTEQVTGDEAAWIVERVGRDGEFDENERALIRFLSSESPKLHPALQPLLDRAA
jgi:hypothetical protein